MTNERIGNVEHGPDTASRGTAASGDPRGGSDGGRRALLAGGAVAAAGAAFFTTARPARAASGDPLLLGRANTATGGTSLQATASVSALTVYQKGSGNGAFLVSDGTTGVTGRTLGPNAWATVVQNAATATGLGGGLRVEGRQNTAVFADVDTGELEAVAVAAFGGDPEDGAALFTRGMAMMDGDVLALRNYVGVVNAQSQLDYAAVSSAQVPTHGLHGTLTLDARGTGEVELPGDFLAAVRPQTMVVTLTPVGGAMPDLHIVSAPTADSDGFAVAGGLAGAKVNYAARAERHLLGAPALAQPEQKAQIKEQSRSASAAASGPRRPRLRFTGS